MNTSATVIAIANQKGGVGKTTTANALATGLKKRGFQVLAIDFDPQGNLSTSVRAVNDGTAPTIVEVLKAEVDINDAIQHLNDFDIIPSNILLAGYETYLISAVCREHKLRNALLPITNEYDYIIIDTAPSLSCLTINALVAANEVIVPIFPSKYAVDGMEQFIDTVDQLRELANPNLKISGVLLENFDIRRTVDKILRKSLHTMANLHTFNTCIRVSSHVGKSQVKQINIYDYDKSAENHAAPDFNCFIDEYLNMKEELKY